MGSPKPQERQGDGACVVLRDQESWLQGEGRQGLSQREKGMRNAEGRNSPDG